MLCDSDRYTHVNITGHVEEMREDTDLADLDRLAQQHTGKPYPQRGRRRTSTLDRRGRLAEGCTKDSRQPSQAK